MSRDRRPLNLGHTPAVFASAVTFALLVTAGVGHRLLLPKVEAAVANAARLARPLTDVPLKLGPWRGEELPLEPQVSRVVNFDDEYINRRYIDEKTGRSLSLFVGYVGRPRANVGHRPDVCYAAHGSKQIRQEKITFSDPNGRSIPGILYEFRMPGVLGSRILVLGTYLINGHYSNDPEDFQRYNTRNPGLLGERRAYLTRVQIALTASGDHQADVATLCDLAARLAGPIASAMPYVD